MKVLLVVTALIEFGAGAALVLAPANAVLLLLGAPLETSAAMILGRVTGIALLTIGLANWLAHYDAASRAARGLITAMVLYNLGATLILFWSGTCSQTAGVLLWPAVILHTVMTFWCISNLLRTKA